MAFVNLVGAGFWVPQLIGGTTGAGAISVTDTLLLDADEEEGQIVGCIHIEGGGSKTFGGGSSAVGWRVGSSTTFASGSTLTIGVKKTASVDTANGPPARATIGAAAFDVYKALVGGTDTLTSSAWREDLMPSGTPYTVTSGDLMAICWHLDTTSGSPSVKISQASATAPGSPGITLVTSGPTYTAISGMPNAVLTFSDGTLGWMSPSVVFSASSGTTGTIGNGNIYGNIFRVPFPCKIDSLAVLESSGAGGDFALELYTTPLGTPGLVESIAVDQNTINFNSSVRMIYRKLSAAVELTAGVDYCVGLKQTTATAVIGSQYDVSNSAHFKPVGLDGECYAAISTAGATFVQQNSGLRRYAAFVRISAVDDGTSPGSLKRIIGG